MDDERLLHLFEQATRMPSDQRAAFIADQSGEDAVLRQELESLLAADDEAIEETFWAQSALKSQVIESQKASSSVGHTIGNYRLVELLGKGGMGAVYRAERVDAVFEKSVAIKVIDTPFCSPELISHFRSERQILASLEHPNIARLLDGGSRADGLPYFVMEYVEGIPPYTYCEQHGLSTEQRLRLFLQVCSAVHFSHQNMVIHRDLKPANILVTADGTAKLLDFGIAKVFSPDSLRNLELMTSPGTLKMTARYASPEQVRGQVITTASDVYSLGVLLYELLSGHSPYGDAERPLHQWMHAVCEEEPPRPSVWRATPKGDLDSIVLKALRKIPGERYASVDNFSRDLQRYLERLPVEARARAPFYVAGRFVRRNRVAVAVASLLFCTLVAALVEMTLARARAERRFNDVRQLAHAVMFDYADAIDRLPGATPVRARLISDALRYLDDLSKEANTPQLQKEIVDAYVRVSNVQGNEYENNLGDTAAAMQSAQKAVSAADKLLKVDNSLAAAASAASAYSTFGSLKYATGDLHAAQTAYLHAAAFYQQIVKGSPQDIDNRIELSTCYRHLGDVSGGYGFNNLGDTSKSIEYYQKAEAVMTSLTSDFPNNIEATKEAYKTLISVSTSESAIGRNAQAVKDLELALTQIQRASLTYPRDTNVRVELAVAESRLGQLLVDQRQFADAARYLLHSDDLLQHLLDADPGNTIYRRGQTVVEAQLAAALRGQGSAKEAIVHNQRAVALARKLSSDAPQSAQYRSDVGAAERKLSDGLLAIGDSAGALRSAQEAEETLCPPNQEKLDANSLANCDRAMLAAGNAYISLRNWPAAVLTLRTADKVAAASVKSDPTNAVFTSDWARVQAAAAEALAKSGEYLPSRDMYQSALDKWSTLQRKNVLTAEDAYRYNIAMHSLTMLARR